MPIRITEHPQRLTTPAELQRWSLRCHAAGMTVGLVPTMGALHAGHRGLIERAIAECDRVVVSIFVNPLQFGPNEDYERYPRSLDADVAMLREAGVHAVFTPSVSDMYPEPRLVGVHVNGALGSTLEAAHRPGHFDGVALAVTKLLVASRADRAYFGQKDAQQRMVVEALARELDTGVRIVVCEVVRDRDGLALSSRNTYLSAEDRVRALAIPRGLAAAAHLHARGERRATVLQSVVLQHLDAVGAAVDYVAVVEPDSVQPVDEASDGCQILLAAKIGSTRLIDSLRLGLDDAPVVHASD